MTRTRPITIPMLTTITRIRMSTRRTHTSAACGVGADMDGAGADTTDRTDIGAVTDITADMDIGAAMGIEAATTADTAAATVLSRDMPLQVTALPDTVAGGNAAKG